MEEYLRVGVISNTHGIKGEVKVYPTTDDRKRFYGLTSVWLDEGDSLRELRVKGVRFHKNMVLMTFDGYGDINQIEPYKGKDLLVARKDAVVLAEGEYFICDVIGSSVITEEGEPIGVLIDVITTGANDVYLVKGEDGREILLPVIKECVHNVDVEKKTVTARVMPGLEWT